MSNINSLKKEIVRLVKVFDNTPISFLKFYKHETCDRHINQAITELVKENLILLKDDLVYTSESKFISLIEN
jgi:hypothetical protein